MHETLSNDELKSLLTNNLKLRQDIMKNLLSIDYLMKQPNYRALCICTDSSELAAFISNNWNCYMHHSDILPALLEDLTVITVIDGIRFSNNRLTFESRYTNSEYNYAFPIIIDNIKIV